MSKGNYTFDLMEKDDDDDDENVVQTGSQLPTSWLEHQPGCIPRIHAIEMLPLVRVPRHWCRALHTQPCGCVVCSALLNLMQDSRTAGMVGDCGVRGAGRGGRGPDADADGPGGRGAVPPPYDRGGEAGGRVRPWFIQKLCLTHEAVLCVHTM